VFLIGKLDFSLDYFLDETMLIELNLKTKQVKPIKNILLGCKY